MSLFPFFKGMDTDKDTSDAYKPNFMQHFEKQQENQKKGGKKSPQVGPQSIYAYFPEIPDGVDFRDFVSLGDETENLRFCCWFIDN